MKIQINTLYIYQNDLVQVVGAHKKGLSWRYLIQWGDIEGRACSAEVEHFELSAAPTMARLYHDYQQALEVICKQANKINAQHQRYDRRGTRSLRQLSRRLPARRGHHRTGSEGHRTA